MATSGRKRASIEPGDLAALLKDGVTRGDLAPGQRLIEVDVMRDYGATRAVVRTALRDLAKEGLVELRPHRGASIRRITFDEAVEISEIRILLESMVAAKAAERATADDIERLQRLRREMREALDEQDTLAYSEINWRLHETVADIARHSAAKKILGQLPLALVRHQFQLAQRLSWLTESVPEHERIIEAIAGREPALAETAMRDHLVRALEAMKELATPDKRRPALA